MRGGSNQLLGVHEVAGLLGVSETTVYRKWRAWKLPAHLVGKQLKWRMRDIDQWLETRRVE